MQQYQPRISEYEALDLIYRDQYKSERFIFVISLIIAFKVQTSFRSLLFNVIEEIVCHFAVPHMFWSFFSTCESSIRSVFSLSLSEIDSLCVPCTWFGFARVYLVYFISLVRKGALIHHVCRDL